MFAPQEPWQPALDWNTNAGHALDRVIAALPRDRQWMINVFGSAPLQMALDPHFASADVDIFTREDWREVVLSAIAAVGLDKSQSEFFVQCVPETAFRTSPRWRDRAFGTERGGIAFRFAHPIDILIGKLNRLADKDVRAFHLVIDKTGHPTDAELIAELRIAPELFSFAMMPLFGEGVSFWQNVEALWPQFFGRKIDVEKEILIPARDALREAYDTPDWRADLEKLAQEPPEAGRGE
ncbi:MAG TPA: hypothetical protein VEO95_06295 [Chthoniobacteraceae bacterium]|nr:hypothetical protein [Chthoniobacteraceae bacterium]